MHENFFFCFLHAAGVFLGSRLPPIDESQHLLSQFVVHLYQLAQVTLFFQQLTDRRWESRGRGAFRTAHGHSAAGTSARGGIAPPQLHCIQFVVAVP